MEPNLPHLAFLVDEDIPKERAPFFARLLEALRNEYSVDLLSAQKTTEEEFLEKLRTRAYTVILIPHNFYSKWTNLEATLGLERKEGIFAAVYVNQPTAWTELFERFLTPQAGIYGLGRTTVLDLTHLEGEEALFLLKTMASDPMKTGLKPLLSSKGLIYCDRTLGESSLSSKISRILEIPEIKGTEWISRKASLQIVLNALSELYPQITSFRVGIDRHFLGMRILVPEKSDSLSWRVDLRSPTSPSSLLLRYSDFIRVHSFSENHMAEVVVGFFKSAPSEKLMLSSLSTPVHTLWIEPLSALSLQELPNEVPIPELPYLKNLPTILEVISSTPSPSPSKGPGSSKLREEIAEQEQKILGMKQPLDLTSLDDAEHILQLFQERYFDARYQIRKFELEIAEMEKTGVDPEKANDLRLRMEALANREKAWISKLAALLASYKKMAQGQ